MRLNLLVLLLRQSNSEMSSMVSEIEFIIFRKKNRNLEVV